MIQMSVLRRQRAFARLPMILPTILPAMWLAALLVAVLTLLAGCNSTPREPEAQWSAERLYAEAKEEASQGNYERAGKLYERLEGRASGTALAQQAQIERAYMLYKGGDKAQALSTLERFIKLHPTSAAVDYALYLQGLTNFNDNLGLLGSLSRQDLSERDQQAARDSYQSFKQLVDQFPQSLYADDSRARMNYIVNALAAYEVHVARYYFKRGAYVAAANRAQIVVAEFQQSPSAQEALYLMAESYDRLGLAELRDDANRVLQKNFPGTAFAGPGSAKKAWWQIW
jgi:outer membrane protein assembly factor BamD